MNGDEDEDEEDEEEEAEGLDSAEYAADSKELFLRFFPRLVLLLLLLLLLVALELAEWPRADEADDSLGLKADDDDDDDNDLLLLVRGCLRGRPEGSEEEWGEGIWGEEEEVVDEEDTCRDCEAPA